MFTIKPKKDFLQVNDLDGPEITGLLDLASELKERRRRGEKVIPVHRDKLLGMIFTKPSTRTRVSFEAAIMELGGRALTLTAEASQIGRGESPEDTGRVLSRYLDAVAIRTFDQSEVERLARSASIPVINALTDQHHPCQALADFLTIREKAGDLGKVKLAYFGDGNNVCHSLLQAAARLGVEMLAVTPEGYEPNPTVLAKLQKPNRVKVTTDPAVDLKGVNFIYTDVWLSMGEEKQTAKKRAFKNYQVNQKLLKRAAPGAMVLHCLPAHRGEEISAEVIDGPQSIVWDQVENRLHFQKALLAALL
ncbi:MAG TPA: ornithine carbamoyltransferase [bacterium]|nr:ornithine carbamoyltransferase [bacterium]HNS48644.1 ornithine carbamoyltransferase [bacterium]